MKIGRNELCPCGSGKKYKKCCLLLQAPARRPLVDAQPPGGLEGSTGAGLQPEGAGSATALPQFWDEYSAASIDTRIQILHRVVEEEQAFDGDLAFDLLVDVVVPLQHLGRLEDAEAALDHIRDRQPGAYQNQVSWFDEWRVENALLAGRDIEGPLLEFTSRPEANIDGFFGLIDRLLYHGRTTELLVALAPAWNAIKDSPDVTDGGKQLLKQIAADVVVDHQLSLDSNAEQCAPELLEQIVSIVDCDRAQIDKSLRQRAGDREFHWCVEDFAGGTDRKDDRLQLLVMDFSRHLRSRHGWPPSRASLAAHEIGWYLVSTESDRDRGQSGRSGGRGRRKKRGGTGRSHSRLCLAPTASSADRFAAGLIDPISPHPARAAAFYEALPQWIEFVGYQSLIPETDATPLKEHVIRRLSALSGLLERLIADPVMHANVRRVRNDTRRHARRRRVPL